MGRNKQNKSIMRDLHTIIPKSEYLFLKELGEGYINRGIMRLIRLARSKEVTVKIITELKV